MSQTTQEQIDAMKTFCEQLDKSVVKAAHVDDWGRYGNFTVMITPVEHTRQTTNKLKALVRKGMPAGAHLRECFAPEAQYESRYGGGRRRTGYNRSYWTFDIDYQTYHAGSNSFS